MRQLHVAGSAEKVPYIMLILTENGPFLVKIESSATMALISLLGEGHLSQPDAPSRGGAGGLLCL